MINDKQIKAERYTKAKPRRDMKPKYTVKELRDQGPGSITGFHCRIGHSSKVFYMTYKNPNTVRRGTTNLAPSPRLIVLGPGARLRRYMPRLMLLRLKMYTRTEEPKFRTEHLQSILGHIRIV